MKLNKMLALALSGVMAVSMLAGCSGAPSNGEEGDKEQTVVTAGTATMMNNFQNRVKFDADADLDAYVAAAVKTLKSDVIKEAPASVTQIDATGDSKDVYVAVRDKLPGSFESFYAQSIAMVEAGRCMLWPQAYPKRHRCR